MWKTLSENEVTFDSATRRNRMMDEVRELGRYRDLVRNLVRRNVTARYKRSVLGVLWTLLDPLATMLIMAVVFSALFAQKIPDYPVFLFSGIIIWNFFSQASTQAMGDFIFGRALIGQVYMPKSVFAFSAVGTGVVNLMIAFLPVMVFLLVYERPFTLAILFLPIPFILAVLFTLGAGLIVSALAIYFADMLNIYQIVLRLLMYFSGIFYSVESLPSYLQTVIKLIPTYQMVMLFRYPLYYGELPPLGSLLYFTVWSALILVIGMFTFTKLSDAYVYRV
jgi:ABC-type polysaccharide/polyol phosphate export permease